MTLLSVNVNKIAVLRNSRGGALPDPLAAARACVAAGCGGITVHPRPDARHIRSDDVAALAAWRAEAGAPPFEFNIEGNPFAPPRPGYPGLLALVEQAGATQCTLVPDGDGQLTSDHGFDLARDAARLAPVVARLRALGVRSSLFIDAGTRDLRAAADIGVERIELYTGPYAEAFSAGSPAASLQACRDTADAATALGIGVNAGHDLDQANLATLLRGVPAIAEVSIGHALVGEALYHGLAATVAAYRAIIASVRTPSP